MHLPYRWGRYSFIKRIASGGTAEIFLGEEDVGGGTKRPVVIKRLLDTYLKDTRMGEMLRNEARLLARLSHQSIAQIIEYGEIEGQPFIVMEYVNGIDCGTLIDDAKMAGSVVPLNIGLFIIRHMLQALNFAHGLSDENGQLLGVVHRDISPSNILISWNGEVKLTDFGIAYSVGRREKTMLGEIKGKISYMAPEQASGEGVDCRTDIFSLGVVMYELLLGKRPFDAATDIETLARIKCARLGDINEVPGDLRMVLFIALKKDPRERYQSAEEMLIDIVEIERERGISTTTVEFARNLHASYPELARMQCTNIGFDQKTAYLNRKRKTIKVQGVINRLGISIVLLSVPFLPMERFEVSNTDIAYEPKVTKVVEEVQKNRLSAEKVEFIKDNAEDVEYVTTSKKVDSKNAKAAHDDPYGTLSVQVRPWGIVSIKGYLANREAPVTNLKVKEGVANIVVNHPPTNRILTREVIVKKGDAKRCSVSFEGKEGISCK